MTQEQQDPNSAKNLTSSPSSSSSTASRVSGEININSASSSGGGAGGAAPKIHYPNPPDATNPDAATLREQWRFAIRQYSRWYSHAWGTAILAGISFFALGWIIKGSNPLPSRQDHHDHTSDER
ncbi:PREDICTED: uncharacterized protein LOC104599509 [Nelumbo nucifera]|uniref:Uncharacterized protein LOC104599509 n=2 Tax=Nelumbo nucifera TaxID=4432 RepID=A0A1U8A642_NELNU|nr:PREDICTED: uncharacterized protein LOC104599509 [Nelumbo nucifera]XP_010260380.1 PREDICTED: uncharacterized protein LOC104599509 [Nelumbo nucifera]DAD22748.1 TPA_asm: hypothetical protein HUJ06_024211 [Nelumbo nucifera]